ncbi:hypothetical protein O6H91_20G060200 [Diphasiastrum complanatum]|nr:hypothetical protein O6H91_20G060200 [Diphasiastrum complanatum]
MSTVPTSIVSEPRQGLHPSNEISVRRQTSGLPPLDFQAASIRYSRPISHTSNDGPSIMLQPRSYSFSEASSFRDKSFDGAQRGSAKLAEALSCEKSGDDGTQKDGSSSVSSEQSHFKYLSARAVAERLARAIRGSSKSLPNNARCSPTVSADIMSNGFQSEYGVISKRFEECQMNKQEIQSSSCPSSNNRNHKDLSECSEITFESARPHSAVRDGYHNLLGEFDCIGEHENFQEQTGLLFNQELYSDSNSVKGPLREIHVDSTVNCYEMETAECNTGDGFKPNRRQLVGQERQLLGKRLESFISYFDPSNEDLQERARSAEERAAKFELDVMVVDDFILKHDHLSSNKEELRKATATKFHEAEHTIKELQEAKRSLALEVAAELRQRIAERDSAKRMMGFIKTAVDSYVKVSEREKQELQSGLEKELESKHVENTELRERIKKLEEEKAGLQIELTSVSSQDNVLGEKVRNFELLMKGHRKRVEEAEKTILHLRQASVYAQKRHKEVEEELQALRKSNQEREGENHVLRRSLSRLQQLCQDHENNKKQVAYQCLNKSPSDGDYFKHWNKTQLQQELLRLSRIEKTLQGELYASRLEANTLSCQLKSLEEKLRSKEGDACISKSNIENSFFKSQTLALQSENSRWLQAALNDENRSTEAFETSKVSQSLQFGVEGAKLLNEMLDAELFDSRAESCTREEAVEDRYQIIGYARKSLDTESELFQQHTERNEELVRHCNAKNHKTLYSPKQPKEKIEGQTSQVDLEQANGNLEEFRRGNRVQETKLELLREKLTSKEVELELLKEKCKALSQCRGVVQSENTQLQSVLINVNKRVAQLENKLREKEEKIVSLEELKEESLLEILRLRKERDDMQKQAEDLGREALRMSAQVEVLRRKANQLEEDVLLKEGQISILKGTYEACD